MPYNIKKRGDEWCVIKKVDGKEMGCHDSEAKAQKQLAALHASEKSMTKTLSKYTQADVSYNPVSTTAGQLCANCRWFKGSVEYNRCQIVIDYPASIEPTGRSNKWELSPILAEPENEAAIEAVETAAGAIIDVLQDKTVQAIVVSKEVVQNTREAMALVPKEYITNSVNEDDGSYTFVQYQETLFESDSIDSFVSDDWHEGVTAITGDFKVEPEYVTGYISPDNSEGLLKKLGRTLTGGHKPGHNIIKAADGSRYMLLVTSNAYKDREKETITTKAWEEWADHCWRGDVFYTENPLLLWHEDKARIAQIVWADVMGGFLIEVAKEDNTPIAEAAFDYYENPDEPTGASHRFAYYRHDKDGEATYHHITKLETSILPREVAANNLTFGGIIPMTDKRGEYLNKIFGLDNAAELLEEGIEKLNDALQAQGVEKKSKTEETEKAATNWANMMDDIIVGMGDLNDELQAYRSNEKAFETVKGALEQQVKDLTDKVDGLVIQLDTRPRQASRAAETEIEPDKIPEDARDAMVERDPFFRVPVRSE